MSDLVGGTAPVSIVVARSYLYERLPQELRAQLAYRHFFTEELDRKASMLSLKFFSLFIAYFCSLCRLQGRRRQYNQNQSEKSGASFAKTHRRTKALFQRLHSTYGQILLRYNSHSDITVERRLNVKQRQALERGGNYSYGLKNPVPLVKREKAFRYSRDELRFYEELYVFTDELLRLVFKDERLQGPISAEVNRVFRSAAFSFSEKARSSEVSRVASTLERESASMLLNHRQLAEMLVPRPEKVRMKYAVRQRSPFVACRLPGSISAMRYQRPVGVPLGPLPSPRRSRSTTGAPPLHTDDHRPRAESLATPQRPTSQPPRSSPPRPSTQQSVRRGGGVEDEPPLLPAAPPPLPGAVRRFATEVRSPMFDRHHRALQRAVVGPASPGAHNASVAASPIVSPFAAGGSAEKKAAGAAAVHAFLPQLTDYDEPAPERPQSPLAARAGRPPAPLTPTHTPTPGTPSMLSAAQRVATANKVSRAFRASVCDTRPRPADLEDMARICPVDPQSGEEDWTRYDPGQEIESVYQLLANGIVLQSFSIPEDILCDYDDTGMLLVSPDGTC